LDETDSFVYKWKKNNANVSVNNLNIVPLKNITTDVINYYNNITINNIISNQNDFANYTFRNSQLDGESITNIFSHNIV